MDISELKKLTKTRRILFIGNVAKFLTKREYKILCLRFGINCGYWHTLSEIAKKYKITPMRISQIETKAFKKVKCYMEKL